MPIDPELPLKRKELIIKDTQARLVIMDTELEGELPLSIIKMICVDEVDSYNKLAVSNLNTEMTSKTWPM